MARELRLFGRRAASPLPREEARTVRLGEREVAYMLRRSARRTLALHVGDHGVRVSAPVQTGVEAVEQFIAGHHDWLIAKLAQRADRAARSRFVIEDGAGFPLFGECCRLRIGERRAGWARGADGVEELHLARSVDPVPALVRALRRRALPWYTERVREYCYRLGLDAPRVALSSARTRWGSCSSISGIRLHWRLIHLPPELIDYVVAHEVAHLVEMNHSARFWEIVGSIYPGWQNARRVLRAAGQTLPSFEVGTDPVPITED